MRAPGRAARRGRVAKGEREAERASLAYVLEHYEEVAAKVAAIEDPAQRAEAERHLRAIREEAAGREPRRQEREQERSGTPGRSWSREAGAGSPGRVGTGDGATLWPGKIFGARKRK